MTLPWVISVDDHVVEPPHVWQTWLPARWRDRGPKVVDGMTWEYEDLRRPIPQVMACAGFSRDQLTIEPIPFDEMRPGCHDPKARLADMDLNKTERSLCFPSFPRFAGQTFLEAKDHDLAHACVVAFNDWMVEEWCGDSGGRLIPLCLVPLWNPAAAAAEVRRNAGRGCHAITFTELPANLGLPSIHSRHWDPLLDACNETGTVVCMHIGSGSKMQGTSDDAPPGVTTALTSLNAYMAMADWLLSGALARFPRLKIAFSESQVGWMPFLIERLDRVFTESYHWSQLDPSLTERPSTYVPGRVYGCFFDDMVGVEMRHRIGVTQLVFETDYPHQDSTWPETEKLVAQIAAMVPPDELELLVRGNAITMLDLPASL